MVRGYLLQIVVFLGVGLLSGFSVSCNNIASVDEDRIEELNGNLKLTEIHYNPVDGEAIDGNEFEFIELKNTGEGALELSDVGFTEGIDYTFSSNATLEPGSFIVLASNGTYFENRYGFKAFDVYENTQLSNGGEEIEVSELTSGRPVISLEYDDAAPWPIGADGLGYSLAACEVNPDGDPDDPSYWCLSHEKGGSPGRDDSVSIYGSIISSVDSAALMDLKENLKLTEIHYHPLREGLISDTEFEFIELKNTGEDVLDLSNIGFGKGTKYVFPSETTLEPDSFIVLASNDTCFENRYGFKAFGIFIDSQLSNGGEEIELNELRSGDPIISLEYDNKDPWPVGADGLGYSLVAGKVNPDGDPDDPSYWSLSHKQGGSPGKDDSVAISDNITPSVDSAALMDLKENLKLTEIHYHPFDEGLISGTEFEFLELKNTGDDTLDLSYLGFTKGIEYTFSSNTTLEPDSFIVLASNDTCFENRYGFKAFGVFIGSQLSNGGEEIELTEPRSGTPIFSLEYGITAPWPEDADGFGYSIVSCEINPTGNPYDPSYWCLSHEQGGSPGRDDSASVNENL